LTTPLQKPITACIIDDDEIFVFGLKKLFRLSNLNANLIDFKAGYEALNFLTNPANKDVLPDILLVDINMPLMSGWEFLEKFEEIQSQLGKKISVYNISSSVDLNDIVRAQNNPLVADYLLKPISETLLATIISAHINTKRESSASV